MRPKPRYQPGDKIGGRYQVHQALMGGMGEVYLCLDLETNLPFALKTFQQRYLTNPKLHAAFENEVATWVALEKHPNIVRCFYMDTLDNQPFLFLEWIASDESRGTDLRSWLRRGPLGLRLALDFTIDICRGLIHAHEKQPGIVHRDLKPDNILVAQGRLAKITDFGLAKIVQEADLEIVDAENETDGRQSLLGQGGIVGTPPYMAPEQWRSEALDARTDIYAVGCILYEMLIGSWPFQATTLDSLRRQHLDADIPKLADGQTLLGDLDTLLARCLAKQCEERFATVNDLLEQLNNIYEEQFAESPRVVATSDQFTAMEYAARGDTYYQLQQYEKALADYNHAIYIDPTLAEAFAGRGNSYQRLQCYREALADHTRSVQLDPASAPAHLNRGNTYLSMRRYDEALTDHTHAIELDPTLALAYVNRGNTYTRLQRYEEAIADFTRAIQLDSSLAAAYFNRGNTYKELQRYEEALADYTKAAELDPADAQIFNNRGAIYNEIQCYEEALEDFTRAIELDPIAAFPYTNRAGTYVRLHRIDQALEDLKCAIQLDRTDPLAYLNIGVLLSHRRILWEAILYFERASQLGLPQATQYAAQAKRELGIPSAVQISVVQMLSESFQYAGSPDDIRHLVIQFPFMANQGFILAAEEFVSLTVPQDRRSTFEQRLAWLRQIANDSAFNELARETQLAFNAFLSAGSLDEMRNLVAKYPFMTDFNDFIAGLEEDVGPQLPLDLKPAFEQRLAWLRQIASEQK